MHDTDDMPGDILKKIKQCAAVLRSGGIAAFPTDTVYGLGADIYNESSVKKIYAVKQRPLNLPLPVLVYDLSQLKELVADIPAAANKLMAALWPGALTLVFNKAPDFNSPVLAGQSKIAIRMPGHSITLRLIEESGCPIVGTSANLHGLPAVLTAQDVKDQMGAAVDFILDGGSCPGGVESTIVDVSMDSPAVLRPGAIDEKRILDLLL